MFLIITIACVVIASSNYTLNFSQIKVADNPKEAQIFLQGQFISSLNHLNVTEEVQKDDVNFLYQIWYNINYTVEFYEAPVPASSIDPEDYKADKFPETDEDRTRLKNYIEEWKGQTDEDKSIVLQSLAQKADEIQLIAICGCWIVINQAVMIEANKQNKKSHSSEYIPPIPWQHVQMPEDQYRLSRFVAQAYRNNITIEAALQSLPIQEQWQIYQTFCLFFGITATELPPTPAITTSQTEGTSPIPHDPPIIISDPYPPAQPTQPQTHDKEQQVFIYVMGLVFLMIFLYYLAQKIKNIIRMRQDGKFQIQLEVLSKP